jgi:hypothetical protein
LIAVGATAVPTTIITFLPFFGSGNVGLAFSIYTLAYASWEVLLFYAGYLSLKGRKSQQGKRRIWDPDLEPLEANFSPREILVANLRVAASPSFSRISARIPRSAR